MGGVDIPCLLDTETQSFFAKHFVTGSPETLKACHWIRLWAANGLAIPYIGSGIGTRFSGVRQEDVLVISDTRHECDP